MSILKILGCVAAISGGLTTMAQAQTTQPAADQVYTRVTPCRAFDVNIAANTTKTLLVSGTGFTTQKGPAAGCGVPASATAVSVNLAVFNPAVAGYLVPFAAGSPRPNISAKYYQAGATYSTDTIAQVGGGSTSVYSYKTARVLGDITGYYAPQIRAWIRGDAVFVNRSSRVIMLSKISIGWYRMQIDRNIAQCSAQATSLNNSILSTASISGDTVDVYTRNVTQSAVPFQDAPFNLFVSC